MGSDVPALPKISTKISYIETCIFIVYTSISKHMSAGPPIIKPKVQKLPLATGEGKSELPHTDHSVGSTSHENLSTIYGLHSSRLRVENGQITHHGRVVGSPVESG